MAYIDDELRSFREMFCLLASSRGNSMKVMIKKAGLSNSYFYKFRKLEFWNPTMKTLGMLLSAMKCSVYDLFSFMAEFEGYDLMCLPEGNHEFIAAGICRMDVYDYIMKYYPEDRTIRFESIFRNKDDGHSDIYYSTIVDVAEKLDMKPFELFEDIYRFSLYRKACGL